MQIKIILDHKEVESMVNKMNHKSYSKTQIVNAGKKIMKAYEEFEKVKKKDEPGENQLSIDDILAEVGGKII